MTNSELISKAKLALENSYSPYSAFQVGAALVAKSGKVYLGTNIENSSFGATVCAERVALFSAIANGENEFSKIAIVGKKSGEPLEKCSPCGICRQTLAEFCDKDFEIILFDGEKETVYTLGELLPNSFKL